jgi:drug/metabolite transporter (DMT)-like permease
MVYVVVFLISVLISAISQIILKKSASKEYDSFVREYINVPVICAYSMFLLSTLLTMFAYKEVPLSLGVLLEAVGYIYIPVLSYFLLKEKITGYKIAGTVFILLGIAVYSI